MTAFPAVEFNLGQPIHDSYLELVLNQEWVDFLAPKSTDEVVELLQQATLGCKVVSKHHPSKEIVREIRSKFRAKRGNVILALATALAFRSTDKYVKGGKASGLLKDLTRFPLRPRLLQLLAHLGWDRVVRVEDFNPVYRGRSAGLVWTGLSGAPILEDALLTHMGALPLQTALLFPRQVALKAVCLWGRSDVFFAWGGCCNVSASDKSFLNRPLTCICAEVPDELFDRWIRTECDPNVHTTEIPYSEELDKGKAAILRGWREYRYDLLDKAAKRSFSNLNYLAAEVCKVTKLKGWRLTEEMVECSPKHLANLHERLSVLVRGHQDFAVNCFIHDRDQCAWAQFHLEKFDEELRKHLQAAHLAWHIKDTFDESTARETKENTFDEGKARETKENTTEEVFSALEEREAAIFLSTLLRAKNFELFKKLYKPEHSVGVMLEAVGLDLEAVKLIMPEPTQQLMSIALNMCQPEVVVGLLQASQGDLTQSKFQLDTSDKAILYPLIENPDTLSSLCEAKLVVPTVNDLLRACKPRYPPSHQAVEILVKYVECKDYGECIAACWGENDYGDCVKKLEVFQPTAAQVEAMGDFRGRDALLQKLKNQEQMAAIKNPLL